MTSLRTVSSSGTVRVYRTLLASCLKDCESRHLKHQSVVTCSARVFIWLTCSLRALQYVDKLTN